MANVALTECSDTADGQKWNAMADGRIAVELSQPRKYYQPKLFDELQAYTWNRGVP